MINEEEEEYDIYMMSTKKHLDIKKVILVVLIIFVIIGLFMIAKKSVEIIKSHKVYKDYETQVIALQKQQEDKQAQIEKEKEKRRKEKIPNLTDERKKRDGKYLSFRRQTSFFNF